MKTFLLATTILRSPSDTSSAPESTPPSSSPDVPPAEAAIEEVANTVGAAAAATGNPIAEEADAALTGAEDVANTVQSDLANHATKLQTAVDGLTAVAKDSTAVAATVSPAAASTVSTIEQKIAAFAADIGADLSILFSHLKL